MVTEVLGGGLFYVQTVGDQKVAAIQGQLAALNLGEAPLIGSFNPKKGDVVLSQFSLDNSWNRALVILKQFTLSVQLRSNTLEIFAWCLFVDLPFERLFLGFVKFFFPFGILKSSCTVNLA